MPGTRKKPSEAKAKPGDPAVASGSEVVRAGTVAIVGRPNVGKSTFLNAALGVELAIVSRTPQTTRQNLLGVVHRALDDGTSAELRMLDTPGLHRGKRSLDRQMNRAARMAAQDADVVVFFTDLPRDAKPGSLRPHPGDLTLLADIGKDTATILVVNKIDRVKDKSQLLSFLAMISEARDFAAVVPICALKNNGVDRVLDEVAKHLPEGEAAFGPDDLTDKPTRFFAAEYVREQILRSTHEEVPHGVAVTIENFQERGPGFLVQATIHVDREAHKKIVVGAGGQMLKKVGTEARKRLEALVDAKVHLELFVRATPGWRDDNRILAEFGYGDDLAGAGNKSS